MRQWGDYVAWGTLGLTLMLFGFLLYNDMQSMDDRQGLRRSLQTQRAMLDARAEIQTILLHSAVENRPLTAPEKHRINELCVQAEYHLIPKGCDGLK